MTFRVGQKVVRIGDGSFRANPKAAAAGYSAPVIGDVVTIRAINAWRDKTILTFEEHDNRHLLKVGCYPFEPGFCSTAFRPIVERKTDISVFTEILRKATKPARTPAMSLHQRGTEL